MQEGKAIIHIHMLPFHPMFSGSWLRVTFADE